MNKGEDSASANNPAGHRCGAAAKGNLASLGQMYAQFFPRPRKWEIFIPGSESLPLNWKCQQGNVVWTRHDERADQHLNDTETRIHSSV